LFDDSVQLVKGDTVQQSVAEVGDATWDSRPIRDHELVVRDPDQKDGGWRQRTPVSKAGVLRGLRPHLPFFSFFLKLFFKKIKKNKKNKDIYIYIYIHTHTHVAVTWRTGTGVAILGVLNGVDVTVR
jgi:hypothetical protein